MVEASEGAIEAVADFFALKGTGCGIDCNFGHCCGNVYGALLAFEWCMSFNEVGNFFGDLGYVGAEGFGGEADFHEL